MMATQTQSFLQGEVADGKYPLLKYLGGSEHSSVFLTRHGNVHPGDAAIKLLPARAGGAAAQLSLWRLAKNLAHPNLIRILDMGRCQIGSASMLYVVTELASENLGEIIPQRPLSAEETREVLASLLDALVFMHSRGFVHGHIKPSNIMAVGEQLKLSTDGICRLGDAVEHNGATSIYDAPEGSRSGASTAGDIWALGVTLVEVLTQETPEWNASDRRDPVPPETMPPPFPEIVRHCLRRDPKNRWPAATLQAHVPSAKAVATPARVAANAPAATTTASNTASTEEAAANARRYVTWGAVAAIVLATILAGAKLVGRRGTSPTASAPAHAVAQNHASANPTPARTIPAPPQHAAASSAAGTRPAERVATNGPPAKPGQAAPQSASLPAQGVSAPKPTPLRAAPPAVATAEHTSTPKPGTIRAASPPAPGFSNGGAVSTSSANGSAPGRVLERVMPDVLKSASNTIWGTVRVGVRVSVDTSGNVTGAELQAAGPSRYFARVSVDAARKWRFAPAMRNGQAAPSAWLLHFGYRKDGTSVEPEQVKP